MGRRLSSRIKIHSNFDEIFTDYHPKTTVDIDTDIGIKMTITIEKDQKNNITSFVDFLYNGNRVHYEKLDTKLTSILIEGYHQYIKTKISKTQVSILPRLRLRDVKHIGKIIKSVRKIAHLVEHYQDLRAVNLFTFDNFQDKILARTTIELDADIVTIIQPELFNTNNIDNFTKLHSGNTILANYLFLYPLTRVFRNYQCYKKFCANDIYGSLDYPLDSRISFYNGIWLSISI